MPGMNLLGRMEQLVDGAAESIERDRFAEDDIDGLGLRPGDFDERAEPGKHDDWNVLFELLDEARGLFAVHLRHGAIEDDEIELLEPEFFQRFAPARGRGYLMSIAAQIDREYFAYARLIVDDEHIQVGFRSEGGLERHGWRRRAFRYRNANDESRSFSDN